MVRWFSKIKAENLRVHISWAYRDKDNQEQAFADGTTRAHFPNSPHNRRNPVTGDPESYALDLFELTDSGIAQFSPLFYAKLADENRQADEPIIWGGNFRSLGDADHFQYSPDSQP